jgi:hypothetical protein
MIMKSFIVFMLISACDGIFISNHKRYTFYKENKL